MKGVPRELVTSPLGEGRGDQDPAKKTQERVNSTKQLPRKAPEPQHPVKIVCFASPSCCNPRPPANDDQLALRIPSSTPRADPTAQQQLKKPQDRCAVGP